MTTPSIPHLPALNASAENALATIERAREYAEASHAAATHRAYASTMRLFRAWCAPRHLEALPATPQTVVLYVTHLAGFAKLATIRRHLAAIAFTHRETGLESPVAHEVVRRVVRGIARTNGAAQAKKAAITIDVLRAMLLAVRGHDLKVKRDRAILLLGFAAALRRSELAALNVEDLRWSRNGLAITIRRSKTDQIGQGAEIAVPFVTTQSLCAARAVRQWLDTAGITSGPIFRTFTLRSQLSDRRIDGRDVANLVHSLAARAGAVGDFSGHSLRAGFITSAAKAKVSLDSIARTSRHKSLTVLMGYVRPAQAFDDVALSTMIA
jgi:integrase